MEIGRFVIVISLFGICLLYCISCIVEPPYVPLDAIASQSHNHSHNYENELIKTRGVVVDLMNLSDRNMLLNIMDNGTELPVFVSSSFSSSDKDSEKLMLKYGDVIELQGRIQQYRGKYEIAASEGGLKKINSDNNDNGAYFVAEIAEYPSNYEGRRIRVVGYICKVYKRIFYLCSEEGESTGYRMRVVPKRLAEPELEKGDKVIIEGVLVYNPRDMRYELELISLSCL